MRCSKIALVMLVLLLATSLAFADGSGGIAHQEEQQVGTATSMSGPTETPTETPAGQVFAAGGSETEAPPAATPTPTAAYEPYVSRDRVEAAANKVEQLTDSGYAGTISADTGQFREVFIGDRRLVLNRSGRVVGVGNRGVRHTRIVRIPLEAFRHQWNLQARRANVVSGTYVDAHDSILQGEINTLNGRVARNGWLGAIALILAIVATVVALSRLPRWRRVYY